MDKNKMIIIGLIIVIIALLVGMFTIMPHINKKDTNLTFISNSTLNEGDSIKIKLTDSNGNLLVNQTVSVTIIGSNNASSSYSIVTNETGFGDLKLDKIAGEYNVIVEYGGSNNYAGCSNAQKLTIKEKVAEVESTSSSSNTGSNSNYDSGAFYSAQSEKVYHTGDVVDTPGGKYRHKGNNEWEPV